MRKYHVKVAVQVLQIYEVEAEDPETAAEDWAFGRFLGADDEALENTVLSVREA
jgi:hypothetical protein